jgi:hypothetical protein
MPGCVFVRGNFGGIRDACTLDDASATDGPPGVACSFTTGGVEADRSIGVSRSETASFRESQTRHQLTIKPVALGRTLKHTFLLMDVSAHPASAPAAPVELSARDDAPDIADGNPFCDDCCCSGGSAESGFKV